MGEPDSASGSSFFKSIVDHGSLWSYRKSCALTFYDLAVELIYEKLAINFGDSPVYKGEFLATFRSSFYNLISSLIKSYQRIVVYFPYDDSLRVKAEGVLAQALESRRVFKKRFGGLVVSFINESEVFKSRKGMDLAVEASNEASTEYWRAMNPVIEQMQQSLRLYLTALNGFLRPNEPAEFPSAMLLFDE
jgi:hypothetical protein